MWILLQQLQCCLSQLSACIYQIYTYFRVTKKFYVIVRFRPGLWNGNKLSMFEVGLFSFFTLCVWMSFSSVSECLFLLLPQKMKQSPNYPLHHQFCVGARDALVILIMEALFSLLDAVFELINTWEVSVGVVAVEGLKNLPKLMVWQKSLICWGRTMARNIKGPKNMLGKMRTMIRA